MHAIRFKPKLRLIHMGILLVSVPLLFELGFIVGLHSIYNAAWHDYTVANRSREISEKINHFVHDIVHVYREVDGKALLEKGADTAHLRAEVADLTAQLDYIGNLVADDPIQAQSLDQAKDVMQHLRPTCEEMLDSYDRGDFDRVHTIMKEKRREMQLNLSSLANSDLLKLESRHKKISEQSIATQPIFHERITLFLLWAAILNIAITVVVAVVFSRRITSRLAILTDNSMRLAAGQTLHGVVDGTDEIAHLDKVFHNMADALAEAERSKQEMIGMVTHDLKTPLTTVSALLEMLEEGMFGQLNDQGLANLKVVGRNVTRMNGLIRDLLDIEKIKSGMLTLVREDLDAKDLLNEAAESVQGIAAEKGIKVVVDCPFLEIYADNQRLQQVLINLLSNAIKFSPKDSQIELAAVPDGTFAHFTVKDHGRGIPANMQEAIFERFKQTHATDATVKGGTGLGLAICKALVELHGGQIGVISEPDKGSTFFFTIPVAQDAEADGTISGEVVEKKAATT
jgi:signal transduction histidine kinase